MFASYNWETLSSILKATTILVVENRMPMTGIADSVITITGGTGSFGRVMANHVLAQGASEVRILSRDENKQDEMRNEFQNAKLKFYIGDVRDKGSVDRAVKDSDFVFHAAALKQVPSCEFFPDQAVATNVLGSGNVISSAIEHSVKSLVCLSTDKAVYPINAMGMSKSLMEKYVLANSRDSQSNKTTLSITRYGNVMMSRGSVIPLFVKQIVTGEKLTITNPEMTRFLMSLEESVQLVEHAFMNAKPGDLFVRKAPACTIETLATAIWRIIRPGSEPQFDLIGTRHGEKVFESLLSSEEFTQVEDQKDYFRVGMDNRSLDYSLYFENGSDSKIQDPYTSHNTKQLDENEVIQLLLSLPSFNKLIQSRS
jgi:UDP-N-acetylglucosamine 4,6-dehydratase/5-epimerase